MELERIAKIFCESNLFPDIKTPEQAMVKIIAGEELGLSPIKSMNSVFFTNGKVGYEVKLFLAKLKKEDKYDYLATFKEDEKGVTVNCTVAFFLKEGKDRKELGSASFGVKEAIRTGLINKELYKSYPKLMMFYRAASDGMKIYCPEVMDGVTFVEDLEELKENAPVKITLPSLEEINAGL